MLIPKIRFCQALPDESLPITHSSILKKVSFSGHIFGAVSSGFLAVLKKSGIKE